MLGITPFAGSSFAEVGSVSITIAITGVSATASVGNTNATGGANTSITSQSATGTVGSTTEITTATTSITADPATGLVGNVVATGDIVASTKKGGDDAPRTIKKLKYKPRLRKDDFGNEILDLPIVEEELEPDLPEVEQIAETINIYDNTEEKYALKQTQDRLNELQSHLEIIQKAIADELDDEEAILMLL